MTEEKTDAQVEGPVGFSIDPESWVEPKESFPGKVLVSAYRWSDPKYLDGVVGRIVKDSAGTEQAKSPEQVLEMLAGLNPQHVPQIPQWDLRVKRLDTILQLADGSQADAVRYGGYDLVKWSNRDGSWVQINLNYGKEQFIGSSWKKIAGTTEPPSVLQDKFFNFDFYPNKRFGGSMPAKRVLVPTSILPPNFTFTGEVNTIVVPDRGDAAEAAAESTQSAAPGTATLTGDEADVALAAFLIANQADTGNSAGILTELPAELRHPDVLGGIANGLIVKRLESEGKIAIAADGKVTAA